METGLYIYNTRPELINTITDDKGCRELIDRVKAGEAIVGEYTYYDSDNARYLLSYSYIADKDWLFILKDSYGEVYNDVKIVRIVLGIVCLGIAVIILMVTYFFTRQTSRELMILEKSILRRGKLDISAADNLKKYVHRHDEIGQIASAVNDLCGILDRSLSDTGRILGEIAKGNLAVDTEKTRNFMWANLLRCIRI